MSRFPHGLAPDDPAVLTAAYQLDGADRRRIDEQILALQATLTELLIRGATGSWFSLDASSSGLAQGDVFVLANDSRAYVVTRASSESLAEAGVAFGVALEGASPGTNFRGVVGGAVPPSVTGLAAPGLVRVSPATARPELCSGQVYEAGDYPLGVANAAGVLALAPRERPDSVPPDTLATVSVPADVGEGWVELWSVERATLAPADGTIRDLRFRLTVSSADPAAADLVTAVAVYQRADAGTDSLVNADDGTLPKNPNGVVWALTLPVADATLALRLRRDAGPPDVVVLEAKAHATIDRSVVLRCYLGPADVAPYYVAPIT